MRVHRAVLEAPEEAHQIGEGVELEDDGVEDCEEAHDRHDAEVHVASLVAAHVVDEPADGEATEDLPDAEEYEREAGIAHGVGLVRVRVIHHFYQVPGEVGDADAGPGALGGEHQESGLQKQMPHGHSDLLNTYLFSVFF